MATSIDLGKVVGDTGATGATGADGSSIWASSASPTPGLQGRWNFNLSDLTGPTDKDVAIGDLIFHDSSYFRIADITSTIAMTILMSYLKGATGATGSTGPTGPTGATGPVMPFCKYRLDSSKAESGTPSTGSQRIVNFALGLDSSESISSSDSSAYFEMTSDGGMKCLQPGIVEISGSIYFSATNMQAGPYIYKNTDEVGTPEYFYSAYSNPVRQIAGIVTNVAANDVIYMKARSTDGAKYTGNRATYLFIRYLSFSGAGIL